MGAARRRLRREVERLQRQPVARVARDFERLHAQAFDHLQQMEVGRRLERDRVARLRDRAQREVDRFHAAVGDDDLIRAQLRARRHRTACDLLAQCRAAGHVVARRVLRMAPVHARHQVLQLGLGQQRARRRSVERRHRMRVVDDHQELVQHAVHADERRVADAQVELRLGQRRRARRDETPRLRPRLHDAAVLEPAVDLQRGADAHAVLLAQLAHRRQPVAGAQRAARDRAFDRLGDALVQRGVHGALWRQRAPAYRYRSADL